jgi:predicted transcriptional regulator
MSYRPCTEYILLMLERELLELDKKRKTYNTTAEKGKEFVGMYKKIRI